MVLQESNHSIFYKLSVYLNHEPRFITPAMMQELTGECGLGTEEAFAMLLAARVGLDIGGRDTTLFARYFPEMVHRLDTSEFCADPYLTTIHLPSRREGYWGFRSEAYTPYEAFVCDDPVTTFDGRVIPQIGFFEETFCYPVVLENGREWMTVTPNEIATMRAPVSAAHGRVLTYGLGLGYYAFMAARKPEVTQVTVVERDPAVIRLYREYVAPQNPYADKISIVEDDAFRYAEERMAVGEYDVVFADIWHDPSDGVEAYRRLKACEKHLPTAAYYYWIEKTLRLYM